MPLHYLSDGELGRILESLEPSTLKEVPATSRIICFTASGCEDALWLSLLDQNGWPPTSIGCGGPESGLDSSAWHGLLRPKERFRLCSYLVSRQLPTLSDALRSAADRNHSAVLDILLKARADPNEGADTGAHGVGFIQVGQYALHLAAKRSHLAVLDKLVLAKAHVDIADQNGRTALMLACASGQSTSMEWLLERGATVNATNHFGQTPLHCAALLPRPEIVNLLLRGRASANCIDRQDQTPLHLALIALPRHTVVAKKDEMAVDPSGHGDEYCYEKNTSHGYNQNKAEDEKKVILVRETAEVLLLHGASMIARDSLGRAAGDILDSKCRSDLRATLELFAANQQSSISEESSAALSEDASPSAPLGQVSSRSERLSQDGWMLQSLKSCFGNCVPFAR